MKIPWILAGMMVLCLPEMNAQTPKGDIVKRATLQERRLLRQPPLREADLFWEKQLWRVLDVREKMNQHFNYPDAPFFEIITRALLEGSLTAYSVENESFNQPLQSFEGVLYFQDTVWSYDPETLEPFITVVENQLWYEDIKRYRIKEHWYFDQASSQLKVQIIGIAPLREVYDVNGNFRYERPLFWLYYPELREILAAHPVFLPGNDRPTLSWADALDMRFFSSTIYKERNVRDAPLDAMYSGLDKLMRAAQIEEALLNREQDFFSQ